MTTLVITPNVKRKTIKCEGRIAAGEHVLVRVETFDEKVGEGKSLRLRAVGPNGETLAVFPPQVKDDDPPRPQEELAWQVDDGDATCVFDFNTAPAEKFLRCGGECLFVLDDVDNHTLYGNGFCTVAPWSKVAGLDAPVDLDGYKDVGERVTVLEDEIASIGEKADAASAEASSAKSTADSAAQVAETARTDAVAAGNAAISAASSASAAQTGAAAASSAAGASAASASAAAASAKSASDKFDALSDVAKSGRYEDLLDKPEIPSIAGLATIEGLSAEENRAKGVERDIIVRLEKTPTLDEGGKVPSSQLPSYVDDVLEYGDRTRFPMFGEGGKIYVDMSTNHLYRWTGTVYVQIPAGLALGETAASAYPGNKGLENAQGIASLRTSKQDKLDASQLAAVNSGITSAKVSRMVTKDDVQPRGDGTEVIAVIGGKEIKAPAGGGGGEGTVKSVANVQPTPSGNVPLTADDIGALSKSGGNVGTSTTAGVLTLMATYDTAPRLEMESAFNAACSFNVPNSGKFDATGEGPKASLKKGGKEVAIEDDVKAVSDKVDAIEDTVNVNNRILVSDDGVDARIQHADEEAEGGWADDAKLVTEPRLAQGYAAESSTGDFSAATQTVHYVSDAASSLNIVLPDHIEGATHEFVVYVNAQEYGGVVNYMAFENVSALYFDGDDIDKFFSYDEGRVTAFYFTEIASGAWAVGKRALTKFVVGA